jgi:WD40 repeat protein
MQGAYNVAFSPDGQLLASSSISGGGTVWDLSTGKERFSFQNDKGQFPRFTHLISDGDFVNGMTSSNDKGQDMWSLSAYPGRKELSAISISFSSDSKLLAHTTFDNTIRLFDTATGKSCGILRGHYEFVKAIAFSPQGRLLASGSFDHAVRVWGSA